jgi:hypothetical protein
MLFFVSRQNANRRSSNTHVKQRSDADETTGSRNMAVCMAQLPIMYRTESALDCHVFHSVSIGQQFMSRSSVLLVVVGRSLTTFSTWIQPSLNTSGFPDPRINRGRRWPLCKPRYMQQLQLSTIPGCVAWNTKQFVDSFLRSNVRWRLCKPTLLHIAWSDISFGLSCTW